MHKRRELPKCFRSLAELFAEIILLWEGDDQLIWRANCSGTGLNRFFSRQPAQSFGHSTPNRDSIERRLQGGRRFGWLFDQHVFNIRAGIVIRMAIMVSAILIAGVTIA